MVEKLMSGANAPLPGEPKRAILLTRKLVSSRSDLLARAQSPDGSAQLTDWSVITSPHDDLVFSTGTALAEAPRGATAADHRCGTRDLRRARPRGSPTRRHRQACRPLEGHHLSLLPQQGRALSRGHSKHDHRPDR